MGAIWCLSRRRPARNNDAMGERAIVTVCNRARIGEEPSERAYWQTRPASERLAALESIRREYHQWRYGAEPRLQRVCRITRQQ